MLKNINYVFILLALSLFTNSEAMDGASVSSLDATCNQILTKIQFKDEWCKLASIEDILQTYGHAMWCLNVIINAFQNSTPLKQKCVEQGIDLAFAQRSKEVLSARFHQILRHINAIDDIETLNVAWRHHKTKDERKKALLEILKLYKGNDPKAIIAFCLRDSLEAPGLLSVTGLSLDASFKFFKGSEPLVTEDVINQAIDTLYI